eukprot:2648538-Pleurochrysis_carterae.AAC.2
MQITRFDDVSVSAMPSGDAQSGGAGGAHTPQAAPRLPSHNRTLWSKLRARNRAGKATQSFEAAREKRLKVSKLRGKSDSKFRSCAGKAT